MCGNVKDNSPEVISAQVADAATRATETTKTLLEDLVLANHILFNNGVVDAFGHVSVRHDVSPDRFLLARNMAPGNVTIDDIVEFNLEGEPVNANGRRVYLERFIHSEIYRTWPDVMAIVHSHSHAIVPLSVVKNFPLRPLFHMAGFIGKAAPVSRSATSAATIRTCSSKIGSSAERLPTCSNLRLSCSCAAMDRPWWRKLFRKRFIALSTRRSMRATRWKRTNSGRLPT
jgi:hypothetical protein